MLRILPNPLLEGLAEQRIPEPASCDAYLLADGFVSRRALRSPEDDRVLDAALSAAVVLLQARGDRP